MIFIQYWSPSIPPVHEPPSSPSTRYLPPYIVWFCRAKVFEDIDRMIHPEHIVDRDVFDLDMIKAKAGINFRPDNSNLSNKDEFR